MSEINSIKVNGIDYNIKDSALGSKVTSIESIVMGSGRKGEVTIPGQLPSTGNNIGDVYYVSGENRFYKWNGTEWVPVVSTSGGTVPVPDYGNMQFQNRIGVNGGTWVVIETGYILAGGGVGTQILIDEQRIASSSATLELPFPVKKGQLIQINGGTPFCYFIPVTIEEGGNTEVNIIQSDFEGTRVFIRSNRVWTVPKNGRYLIIATGRGTSNSGGYGASVGALVIDLFQGEQATIAFGTGQYSTNNTPPTTFTLGQLILTASNSTASTTKLSNSTLVDPQNRKIKFTNYPGTSDTDVLDSSQIGVGSVPIPYPGGADDPGHAGGSAGGSIYCIGSVVIVY